MLLLTFTTAAGSQPRLRPQRVSGGAANVTSPRTADEALTTGGYLYCTSHFFIGAS